MSFPLGSPLEEEDLLKLTSAFDWPCFRNGIHLQTAGKARGSGLTAVTARLDPHANLFDFTVRAALRSSECRCDLTLTQQPLCQTPDS